MKSPLHLYSFKWCLRGYEITKFFRENWFLTACLVALTLIYIADCEVLSIAPISLLTVTMLLMFSAGRLSKSLNWLALSTICSILAALSCLASIIVLIIYTVNLNMKPAILALNIAFTLEFIYLLIKIRKESRKHENGRIGRKS